MKLFHRSIIGQSHKYKMIALARQCADENLHVIDLPYRLSSWALDDSDNIGLWFDDHQQLTGWAVLQSAFWTIDYGCHPSVESTLHREILAWADHRAQLSFGEGSVVVTKRDGKSGASFSVMVRVTDIDDHYEHAKQSGAQISSPPTDYLYGERQYTAQDLGGHRWTFSQTIADVDPKTWDGTLLE